jgi:hypothetical protein
LDAPLAFVYPAEPPPVTLLVTGIIRYQPSTGGSSRLEAVLCDDTRWMYFDRRVRRRYEAALSAVADTIVNTAMTV